MASSNSTPKLVPFEDIKRITNDPSFDANLIDAIAKGFQDFSSGKFNLCPVQTIGAPPMAPLVPNVADYSAQVCIKSGYITGDDYFVVKVASGGTPFENSGLMQVYSQSTGRLTALLLDEGILTELRTAAAGAVAVKYLGPRNQKCIGMVGTGVQARYQLRYMKQVTECRNLLIWGRNPEKINALKEELKDEWDIKCAKTTNELLESCDVVITTTCSREALLAGSIMKDGLVVCMGSDSVGKQELSTDFVANADLLVCDSIMQTQERGEFQHAIRDNEVDIKSIKEIGQVIISGEQRDAAGKKLTIFDSSGVAIQDCVVAKMVLES
mmetsp:Transcript_26563/g.39290  ORF Transcript_26563/g.39290 Transcript_26563/m.39290 type:complete len:326 (+) Transcript_26563:31-1008(+)